MIVIAAAVIVMVVGVGVLVVVVMHAMAMVVVAVVMVLLGGHLVAFKQAHAQQQRQAHITFHRAQDAGIGFDLPQPCFHLREPLLAYQVALVEQQDVAVHHLGPGDFAIENLIAEVLRIDQRDDRVEARGITQIAAQEGHRHGQGVGEAGGFHHQVVHRVWAIQDAIHRIEKLAIDGAADAAVAQLHHVFAGGDDQVVVDPDLAEFVHQHRRFHTLLVAEDVVEQRGFAGSQESGEDRHRQWAGLGRGCGCEVGRAGGHVDPWIRATASLIPHMA